jgi:hypothetical protein
MSLNEIDKAPGIVLKSCETRIQSCSAANVSTVGSGTPARLASIADKKSICGSRRRHPRTIAPRNRYVQLSLKLAQKSENDALL